MFFNDKQNDIGLEMELSDGQLVQNSASMKQQLLFGSENLDLA